MRRKTYHINGYDINLVKTDKFRQVKVNMRFVRNKTDQQVEREILSKVLTQASKKYPSRKKIGEKKEDNYSQFVKGYTIPILGENSIVKFETTFINEKHLKKGHHEKCLDFFMELMFNPIENFRDKEFKSAQKKIKNNFDGTLEDPVYYANIKALINAGYGMFYQEDNYQKLQKITKEDVYQSYLEMINNDILDITIVGDVNEEIIEYFKERISKRKRKKMAPACYFPAVKKQELIEEKEFSQSKLVMLYKLKAIDLSKKYIHVELLENILGGSSTSRLFTNVREKKSLAYDVRSHFNYYKGLVSINAGIDADKYLPAQKIIKQQLADLKGGNITEKELKDAKKKSLNELKTMNDRMGLIVNNVYVEKYYGFYSDTKTIQIIKETTLADLVAVANSLELDTTYFLKGVADAKTN